MATRVEAVAGEVPAPEPTTRDRILYEAAELFARQGFHATTTRQIADAVGVRQPSLFHHFSSKDAIAEALLDWDLERARAHVDAIAGAPASASVRLFRYLRDDVTHLVRAPFNLSGLYTEEVIGRPEFATWAAKRDALHDTVEGIVRDGIGCGEFVKVNTALVRHAIGGILVRALTLHSGGRGEGERLAEEVARLIVRGLLVDTTDLAAVERDAADLKLPGG